MGRDPDSERFHVQVYLASADGSVKHLTGTTRNFPDGHCLWTEDDMSSLLLYFYDCPRDISVYLQVAKDDLSAKLTLE